MLRYFRGDLETQKVKKSIKDNNSLLDLCMICISVLDGMVVSY